MTTVELLFALLLAWLYGEWLVYRVRRADRRRRQPALTRFVACLG